MRTLLRGNIIRDYIECALWADLRGAEGEPMDDYALTDVAPATVQTMRDECAAFFWTQRAPLRQARNFRGLPYLAHDFWLSRNGHGAGFFDRGSQPFWRHLQAAARAEGCRDLYVGDDGRIYQ